MLPQKNIRKSVVRLRSHMIESLLGCCCIDENSSTYHKPLTGNGLHKGSRGVYRKTQNMNGEEVEEGEEVARFSTIR